MEEHNKILEYYSRHYHDIRKACMTHCVKTGQAFSDDVFHDTLEKVNTIYMKRGLKDESDTGILNYCWKSFKTNMLREKQYKANQSVCFVDEMGGTTEDDESDIESDMFNDFAIDYIYHRIENSPEITADDYNIYRLKTIGRKTYRQMQEKYDWTRAQLKESVTKVRKFIRQNINMKDIKTLYNEQY